MINYAMSEVLASDTWYDIGASLLVILAETLNTPIVTILFRSRSLYYVFSVTIEL